jgi:hypothetical protein
MCAMHNAGVPAQHHNDAISVSNGSRASGFVHCARHKARAPAGRSLTAHMPNSGMYAPPANLNQKGPPGADSGLRVTLSVGLREVVNDLGHFSGPDSADDMQLEEEKSG